MQGHFMVGQIGSQAPGFCFTDLPVDEQIGRVDPLGRQSPFA
jgi:hypothetical protein